MDDLLEDLRRFIRENPIDYTECDNYVAWGGSQKGNNYWEGCHHTEETKAYLSEIMSGEGNPFYGKRHTEETRQKMREAAKRRSQTDFAEKQRAALCVNNHYKFLNPEGEPVIINGSLNKFCKDTGLNTGAMSQVHLGKWAAHKGWRKG